MEKMKMETVNLTDENIKKILELFPNVATEKESDDGKLKKAIDFDKLKQELSDSVIDGEESYDFTWVGKREAMLEANKPIKKTLRPDKKSSVNWDTTENLYIEGDNLDALKLLQESYLNKVKMIYIDPPYNTGNDFVYKDNFTQNKEEYEEELGLYDDEENRLFKNTETNGRFHSDWCSMIYPRLKLARNLLTDDGVIFISIDDNEVRNLKSICDEVFGEENCIGQITVVGNPRGRDYGGIAQMHDYILVYSKSNETELSLINDKDHSFKLFDELGGFELRELRNRNIKFNKENRPNLYYPFYINTIEQDVNGLFQISLEKQDDWIELYPLESQGVNTVWRWGKIRSAENMNINIKAKPMKNGSYQIVEKYRESRMMARSVWWDKDTNTEKGTLLVKTLFNNKVFDYAKPVEMILRMLEMGTNESDIILDFFSGSATTAHAVMQLNAEDGGNRKYICVQLPELTDEKSEAYKAGYKNICEIGKERIRRAGTKILENNPQITPINTDEEDLFNNLSKSEKSADNLDIGFRVLKVDSTNMKDVYYTPTETTQEDLKGLISNIKDDRSDEDLLYGILLDWGVELSLPHQIEIIDNKRVHIVNEDNLIACFEDNITETVVREIAKKQPLRAVFRDSSFMSDDHKINIEEIFKLLAPDTKVRVI